MQKITQMKHIETKYSQIDKPKSRIIARTRYCFKQPQWRLQKVPRHVWMNWTPLTTNYICAWWSWSRYTHSEKQYLLHTAVYIHMHRMHLFESDWVQSLHFQAWTPPRRWTAHPTRTAHLPWFQYPLTVYVVLIEMQSVQPSCPCKLLWLHCQKWVHCNSSSQPKLSQNCKPEQHLSKTSSCFSLIHWILQCIGHEKVYHFARMPLSECQYNDWIWRSGNWLTGLIHSPNHGKFGEYNCLKIQNKFFTNRCDWNMTAVTEWPSDMRTDMWWSFDERGGGGSLRIPVYIVVQYSVYWYSIPQFNSLNFK